MSVDVGLWSPIWNITAISNTNIDQIITMNTYTNNKNTWYNTFNEVINLIPNNLLVIGLECDETALSTSDLILRFEELKRNNIKKIAIWRNPIPNNWWLYLDDFILL